MVALVEQRRKNCNVKSILCEAKRKSTIFELVLQFMKKKTIYKNKINETSHKITFNAYFLRTELSDTRNKFNKCDEQQQNRAHISSFHRVNFATTRQLMRRVSGEIFFFLSFVRTNRLGRREKCSVVALGKPTF